MEVYRDKLDVNCYLKCPKCSYAWDPNQNGWSCENDVSMRNAAKFERIRWNSLTADQQLWELTHLVWDDDCL